jgi:hypothetical protein
MAETERTFYAAARLVRYDVRAAEFPPMMAMSGRDAMRV